MCVILLAKISLTYTHNITNSKINYKISLENRGCNLISAHLKYSMIWLIEFNFNTSIIINLFNNEKHLKPTTQ